MNKPALLSIVVPVYNSAETLEEFDARIRKTLSGIQEYELILVDDGSRDDSWEKIVSIREKNSSHVKGIRLSRNFGQHNAIMCGCSFAQGDAVLTMDDDLQHPPEEIKKLLDTYMLTGADVVYGVYLDNKQHNMARNAGSAMMRRGAWMAGGGRSKGSSFRLIKKSLVTQILEHKHQAHIFIDEMLHWYTSRFATAEVEHHERRKGKSGYTFGRLIIMYFDIVINYTAIPLKLMTWIGMLSSFITFLMGLRFIYRKLVLHHVVPGFTAIIVTILFSTSLLMLCMGIVGQYLYKIYHLQSRRPSWSIAEVV